MKFTKMFLLLALTMFFQHSLSAQTNSIVGTWQLVKQSSCLDELPSTDQEENLKNLRKQMHSRTPATPQVVNFKKNSSGTESSAILNTGKTANQKKFYYKLNGNMLLILDKKSQTISISYLIDKFTADSLIVSNASRPCETRIFVKINRDEAN